MTTRLGLLDDCRPFELKEGKPEESGALSRGGLFLRKAPTKRKKNTGAIHHADFAFIFTSFLHHAVTLFDILVACLLLVSGVGEGVLPK